MAQPPIKLKRHFGSQRVVNTSRPQKPNFLIKDGDNHSLSNLQIKGPGLMKGKVSYKETYRKLANQGSKVLSGRVERARDRSVPRMH